MYADGYGYGYTDDHHRGSTVDQKRSTEIATWLRWTFKYRRWTGRRQQQRRQQQQQQKHGSDRKGGPPSPPPARPWVFHPATGWPMATCWMVGRTGPRRRGFIHMTRTHTSGVRSPPAGHCRRRNVRLTDKQWRQRTMTYCTVAVAVFSLFRGIATVSSVGVFPIVPPLPPPVACHPAARSSASVAVYVRIVQRDCS